jgi:hypothetical protein
LIPVLKQQEPAGFDANVRRKGASFLAKFPNPTNNDFKPAQFWKWAAHELYEAYRRICAYSCVYMPSPPGTIDHFLPKSKHPNQAYEWDNLRLASHRMNNNKGNSMDVIDPFLVQPGWFVLDFPSCLVRPGDGLEPELTEQISKTIDILKLNDDDSLVQDRCDMMMDFADGEVTISFLQKRYPFLACEIIRQGIQNTANQIFKRLN